MKRKTVLVLLLAALLISTVVAFAGCDGDRDENNDSDSYWDQPITEVEGKVFEVDSFELHDEEGMTIEEILEDEKRFVYQEFNGLELHFKNGKLYLLYGEDDEPDDRNTDDYEINGDWICDSNGDKIIEIRGNRLVLDWDDWSTYVFFREKGAPIANDVRGNTYAYQSVTIIPDSPQDEALILDRYPDLETFAKAFSFGLSWINFHDDGSADALIMGQHYSWSSYFQPDKYVVGYCENGSYGDDYIARKEGDTLIFENRFTVRFRDEKASVSWKMIMTKQ